MKKPSKFGKWLFQTRETNGISAAEIAEKAGVTPQAIYNIENGSVQNPKDVTVKNIEDAVENILTGGVSEFGIWVKAEREKAGFSVTLLAQKVGISAQAIYNIETGKTLNPSLATKSKLESVLGVTVPKDTNEAAEASQHVDGLGSLQEFDPHAFDLIPAEPGVYVLYDISDRPIYVGRSKNIKKRLVQHSVSFWYKKPIVISAAYIKIVPDTLRNQIEEIMIKFLKSNAVINKSYVDRNLEEK